MLRKIRNILAVAVSIAVLVLVNLAAFSMNWQASVYEKTDAWRLVALRSSDAAEASAALDHYIAGMKELGISEMNTAIFFESAETSLAEHEKQMRQSKKQFDALATLDRRSLEYSNGLRIARDVLATTPPNIARSIFHKTFPWELPLFVTLAPLACLGFFATVILSCVNKVTDHETSHGSHLGLHAA